VIAGIKTPFNRFFVDIGQCVGTNDQIWTFAMNTQSTNTPIVMLHGFGAGLAFWALNLEEYAADRPVYACDLLGYGRSSRPKFADTAHEVEQQYVAFLEKWREKMGIEKMILCAHSFGGFVSANYTMQYPDRIEHLILGDPWGLTPPSLKQFTLWERGLVHVYRHVSPLTLIRFVGPLGPLLLRKGRSDIYENFDKAVEKNHDKTVAKYVYHCNTQKATGENAFHNLLGTGIFPKHPIGERMKTEVRHDIPITILYGEDTWIDSSFGHVLKEARPNSYTHTEIIPKAGHQLFSDNHVDFNRCVLDACKILKTPLANQQPQQSSD